MTDETCPHGNVIAWAIVSRCPDCGQTFTRRLTPESARRSALTQLHQGKLDRETVLSAEWTDDERRMIEAVIPCAHPADRREIARCCSGNEAERCTACGRLFKNSALWILDHEEAKPDAS